MSADIRKPAVSCAAPARGGRCVSERVDTQWFAMTNLTHTNDPSRGFPMIIVNIKRF